MPPERRGGHAERGGFAEVPAVARHLRRGREGWVQVDWDGELFGGAPEGLVGGGVEEGTRGGGVVNQGAEEVVRGDAAVEFEGSVGGRVHGEDGEAVEATGWGGLDCGGELVVGGLDCGGGGGGEAGGVGY